MSVTRPERRGSAVLYFLSIVTESAFDVDHDDESSLGRNDEVVVEHLAPCNEGEVERP